MYPRPGTTRKPNSVSCRRNITGFATWWSEKLPRVGEPLSPDWVARSLNVPVARVTDILDDLEKHMTFLFRDEQGAVTWAYPVTLDRTPHHLTFSTGEQVYAA